MVIYTKVEIGGSVFSDTKNIEVKNRISESNSSSTFSLTLPNYHGEHNTDFDIGKEVVIYADKDPTPSGGTVVYEYWETQSDHEALSGTFQKDANDNVSVTVDTTHYYNNNASLKFQSKGEGTGVWTWGWCEYTMDVTDIGSLVFYSAGYYLSPDFAYGQVMIGGSVLATYTGSHAWTLRSLDISAYTGVQTIKFGMKAGTSYSTRKIWYDVMLKNRSIVSPAMEPTTKIITGIIEDVNFTGKEQKEKIELTGKDYSLLLQKAIVEPTVYTDSEVSTIVQNLMDLYGPSEITTNNVNTTSTVLKHITFKNVSLFDALKQLAELSGYIFYIDVDKDLHFEQKDSVSSDITLDNTNVLSANFRDNADNIFNRVYVYGSRQLIGTQETFTAGSPLGGSVFTLLNKPHNTVVTVNGSIKRGAIFEMAVSEPTSGTHYLVDYDKQQIIFISGTNVGDNIPASGDTIVVDYKRSVPIVKLAEDKVSIAKYNVRSKVITDTSITDPQMARDIALNFLTLNKDPKKEGNLLLKDIAQLTPGNTVTVNLPYHNVNNQVYTILEADYNFTKENMYKDAVLKVKVSEKIPDIVDTIKQLALDIKKLQAERVDTTDVLTRLETVTGSVGLRATWSVKTRNIGSSFILGHPDRGRLGSTVSGVSYLGEAGVTPWVVHYSGVNV